MLNPAFSIKGLAPWEVELANKFPLIFKEDNPDVGYYAKNIPLEERVNLRYGFEHDSGWKELIEKLADTGTKLVTHLRENGHKDASIHGFICKQKFAMLNWQGRAILPAPFQDLWYGYVSSIEAQSKHVCEITGQFGEVHRSETGYVRTLSKDEGKRLNYKPIHEYKD
jgi:hypothetical protein